MDDALREMLQGLDPVQRERFEALRRAFVLRLPERWQQVCTAATQAEQEAVLHQIAGSAGSYGFQALGRVARLAEQSCAKGSTIDLQLALAALQQCLGTVVSTVL